MLSLICEKSSLLEEGNEIYYLFEGKKVCKAEIEELKEEKIKEFFNYLRSLEISNIREYDLGDLERQTYTNEAILNEFKENFEWIDELDNKFKNEKELLVIHYICNSSEIKGLGLKLINHLKEKYKNIILYSVSDAEEYWKNNGFVDVGCDYFLWIK